MEMMPCMQRTSKCCVLGSTVSADFQDNCWLTVHCILYFCSSMMCVVDSFCICVAEDQNFAAAVPRWNSVQALLRKTSDTSSETMCLLQASSCLEPSMFTRVPWATKMSTSTCWSPHLWFWLQSPESFSELQMWRASAKGYLHSSMHLSLDPMLTKPVSTSYNTCSIVMQASTFSTFA